MRTIKELLQVMLDNQELFKTGLCNWSRVLRYMEIINREEDRLINTYIHKYTTKRYRTTNSVYYWDCGLIKPRIVWIKRHIKLLEKKQV